MVDKRLGTSKNGWEWDTRDEGAETEECECITVKVNGREGFINRVKCHRNSECLLHLAISML